jgi:hypothetical protein
MGLVLAMSSATRSPAWSARCDRARDRWRNSSPRSTSTCARARASHLLNLGCPQIVGVHRSSSSAERSCDHNREKPPGRRAISRRHLRIREPGAPIQDGTSRTADAQGCPCARYTLPLMPTPDPQVWMRVAEVLKELRELAATARIQRSRAVALRERARELSEQLGPPDGRRRP